MLAVFHCLLSALIVVFIVLLRQGHPLHKGPVGGWSPEGRCCWPDFKTPSPLLLEIGKAIKLKLRELPLNGAGGKNLRGMYE